MLILMACTTLTQRVHLPTCGLTWHMASYGIVGLVGTPSSQAAWWSRARSFNSFIYFISVSFVSLALFYLLIYFYYYLFLFCQELKESQSLFVQQSTITNLNLHFYSDSNLSQFSLRFHFRSFWAYCVGQPKPKIFSFCLVSTEVTTKPQAMNMTQDTFSTQHRVKILRWDESEKSLQCDSLPVITCAASLTNFLFLWWKWCWI